MPFFSVIIPLYNKEKYVETTLKSVLNQTFNDFEVIIVDDGSTDNSLKIVSEFNDSRIKILKQKNQGASKTRNIGIEHSKSEYITLLDADDLWHEDHLLELKKLIKIFPNAGLFCNNYEINYNENYVKPAKLNFKYPNECIIIEDYFKSSIVNSVAWTSAVAFSKKTFNNIGKFNFKLKTAQDLDLWIRYALNYKVAFNPKITMTYRLNVLDSLSKNEYEYNKIRYDFINSYIYEEIKNFSLKVYLDKNRYALAIRCKMNNENELYKKVKKEINLKNLNLKQKILLHLPKFILHALKNTQRFLIKNKMYITAYN